MAVGADDDDDDDDNDDDDAFGALRSRITKNPNVSTGPLLVCSFVQKPLTRVLARSFTHSGARGNVDE